MRYTVSCHLCSCVTYYGEADSGNEAICLGDKCCTEKINTENKGIKNIRILN